MATTIVTDRPTASPSGAAYRAFISYSHAADEKLASTLQSALQGFAKPWYRLRMIRIFRDKTSLSANPALWPAIERALNDSDWFLLMASEESARSQWVEREVRWWAENRSPDRMLIVLTGGALEWDPVAADFDWNRTTAVGAYISGMFQNDPLFVDLRCAKSANELSLRHSQFRAAVLDLAAPLFERPKDALDGEDVRQHRRSRRLAWSAGIILVLVTTLAVITSIFAIQQARIAEARRQEAEDERQIALGRQLAAQSESLRGERTDFLPTSLLLGVESLRRTFSLEAVQSVQRGLQLLPLGAAVAFQHDDNVNDAVLTPDEQTLITASDDGTVRIWDAVTAVERTRLETGARVLDLGLSQDGRILLSLPLEFDDPGTIHVWDVAARTLLWKFQHPSKVAAGVLSPDGAAVATAGADGLVRIFDAADGRERLQLRHHAPVEALAYAPDRRRLISGDADGVTRVWDLATGREIWSRGTTGRVSSVAFSPDGTHVATGGWDFHARVLTADNGTEVAQTSHTRVVNTVEFSPDSRYLGVASDDGSARVFVAADGSEMRRISPEGGVLRMAFSRDSRLLTTSGLSQVAHVWDIATTREIARLTVGGFAINVRFGPRLNKLVVSSRDRMARVLPLEDGALHHGEKLTAAAFSGTGRFAAVQRTPDVVVVMRMDGQEAPRYIRVGEALDHVALSDDGALLIAQNTVIGTLAAWDVRNGTRRWRTATPPFVRAAELSPDGKLLTWQDSQAHEAAIMDAVTGRLVARPNHDDLVGAVRFSPDGRLVATVGDTTLRIWSPENGAQLHEYDLSAKAFTAAFSQDGSLLAVGGDGMASVRDMVTGRELVRVAHEEGAFAVRFTNDRTILATSGMDGVRLWDVATGKPLRFLAHDGSVEYIAFSPDGAYLATGSRDHSARVWEVTTGRELARMTDLGEAFGVMFDEKARFLLVQHNDAATEFWRPWLWRPDDLTAAVCGRLNRNLTMAEWERFIGNEPYGPTCPAAPPGF